MIATLACVSRSTPPTVRLKKASPFGSAFGTIHASPRSTFNDALRDGEHRLPYLKTGVRRTATYKESGLWPGMATSTRAASKLRRFSCPRERAPAARRRRKRCMKFLQGLFRSVRAQEQLSQLLARRDDRSGRHRQFLHGVFTVGCPSKQHH